MSTVLNINRSEPLQILGYSRGVVTDPVIVDLSKQLNIPALTNITEPVDGAEIELTVEESNQLLDFFSGKPEFEADLQCISQDGSGRALLTTWIEKARFAKMLSTWERHCENFELIDKLEAALKLPAFESADEIDFIGLRK